MLALFLPWHDAPHDAPPTHDAPPRHRLRCDSPHAPPQHASVINISALNTKSHGPRAEVPGPLAQPWPGQPPITSCLRRPAPPVLLHTALCIERSDPVQMHTMKVSELEPRPDEGSDVTNCSTVQNQMSPDNVSGANVSNTPLEKLHEEEPGQQKEEEKPLHTEKPGLQILKEKSGLHKEKPGLHKVAGAQQARRGSWLGDRLGARLAYPFP